MSQAAANPIRPVGVPILDRDHQQLWVILQQLRNPLQAAQHLRPLLTTLWQVATVHFEREEQVMRELDFPNTEMHIQDHRRLMERLEQLPLLLERPTRPVSPLEAMVTEARGVQPDQRVAAVAQAAAFLADWLIRHTNGLDQEYAALLRAQQEAAPPPPRPESPG